MEKEVNEQPVLIGQVGPLNGLRWGIQDSILIGRDARCDVVVIDRQVSRYHARISNTPKGVLLEDLGSKNGTYLNGNMLEEPTLLNDADLIGVALVQQFVYLNSDATMPLEGGVPALRGKQPGIYLETRSRRVWVGEQEVVPPLSVPQFRLLQTLYEQPDRVIPRQDLVISIWGDEEAIGVSEQALDALIRRLRDRLKEIDPEHNYLVTVRGHGVRLNNRKA